MIFLQDYLKEIEGQLLTDETDISKTEIEGGYVSDLLSDVMGNALEKQVWLTIMKHLNVIAVASLAGIPAIVFTKGGKPDLTVIRKAQEEGIALISTLLSTYEATGKLYKMINK